MSCTWRHAPAALAALAVLLVSYRARGEPVSSSTRAPYEVEVRDRPLSSHPDPTQRSTRISPSTLERARVRAGDTSDVLDLVAGARILDLGGPVHERRLTVRGASATGTALIVDDVPVSSPFATGLDVGLVPFEGIEELSLVHGGSGVLYGSGALGGALLIRTRPARGWPSAVTLALGSQETVLLRGATELSDVSVATAYEQTQGDFAYVSRLPGLADLPRVRGNNDARRGLLSTRWQRRLGSGTLQLSAGGALREAGVPGFETQENLEARELRGRGRFRVAYVGSPKPEAARAQLGAHVDGLGIGYQEGAGSIPSQTLFWASGLDFSLAAPARSDHQWRGRVELGFEHSDSTEHGLSSRFRSAVVLSDELSLGDFTVFGALRGELYTGQPLAILPRLGVLWSPGWMLELGLSLGRSFRVPSIDELYHPRQAGLSGNPELIAETAWESELFLRLGRRPWSVEFAVFARRTDDLILYLNRNAFEIRPENLGTANLLGFESSARLAQALGPLELELGLAGSVLAGVLDETGTAWPTLAPYGLSGELALAGFGLELATRARFAAATTANLSGTLETEPYLRWDASFAVHPFDEASLALSVHNLLDQRDLETLNKLPLPGRTVLFSVRVREAVL